MPFTTKEARQKDAILLYLLRNVKSSDDANSDKIASNIGVQHELVYAYLLELAEAKYVDNRGYHGEDLFRSELEMRGRAFILGGGYSAISRQKNWSSFWRAINVVLTLFSTACATYIAYLTYATGQQAETTKNELQTKTRQVDSLQRVILKTLSAPKIPPPAPVNAKLIKPTANKVDTSQNKAKQ